MIGFIVELERKPLLRRAYPVYLMHREGTLAITLDSKSAVLFDSYDSAYTAAKYWTLGAVKVSIRRTVANADQPVYRVRVFLSPVEDKEVHL
jgi:hypothetical protein